MQRSPAAWPHPLLNVIANSINTIIFAHSLIMQGLILFFFPHYAGRQEWSLI